ILADRVQVVAAPSKVARHLAADQRKYLVGLLGRLDVRVDDHLERRFHPSRLLKQPKRKFRPDAERVLAVDSTPRKNELHFLPRRALPRDVGKIDGLRENLRRLLHVAFAHYANRERRPKLFLVPYL